MCVYVSTVLLQEEHWPLFLSVVVVPTFIQLMLLPWFPESPRYLLMEKHNVHATITGPLEKHSGTESPLKLEQCHTHSLAVIHFETSLSLCSLRPSALKWYRAKCNIQAEIEEMQEEQRSLSSVETLSVWKLLRDDTVRWQVLSVAVVNIGMQLSGIDAVSILKVFFSIVLRRNTSELRVIDTDCSDCDSPCPSRGKTHRPFDSIRSMVIHVISSENCSK